ncbi:MAG TPA: serine/threonine-protein kinase [Myxococcales bacterium]|nr:serine/threonine-protein kinase [Myxococcales bacterium]
MGTGAQDPTRELLRRALHSDSRRREQATARFNAAILALSIPLAFVVAGERDRRMAVLACSIIGAISLEYAIQLWFLRRGHYRPALSWFNALFESSAPAILPWMAATVRGSAEAYILPVDIFWGAIVVATSLRAREWLSLAAGACAATWWLVAYFAAIAPRLPPAPHPLMSPGGAILRALLFLAMGGLGELITRSFVRKAQEALRMVREQDLMGKYVLHERVGRGGMAEVYRATYCPEGGFQKAVAVKRVLPSTQDLEGFAAMFLEEARLCASLAHPNVVQVLDCGRYQGRFVLAMEYVDGVSLERLLRLAKEPLPLCAAAYVAAELAAALEYLHGREGADGRPLGLVHCDVNPPNVLLSRSGEVKLADFGISSGVLAEAERHLGKPSYAAPEQLAASGPAPPPSTAVDLYGLGVTLAEAVAGLRPEPMPSLAYGVFHPPELPSERRPGVPPELDGLVQALTERAPERRPPAAEVRRRLLAGRGPAAPFPDGKPALAAAVARVMALHPGNAGE